MRRPAPTITALAAPVLLALAFSGCKKAAGSAPPGGVAGADYSAYGGGAEYDEYAMEEAQDDGYAASDSAQSSTAVEYKAEVEAEYPEEAAAVEAEIYDFEDAPEASPVPTAPSPEPEPTYALAADEAPPRARSRSSRSSRRSRRASRRSQRRSKKLARQAAPTALPGPSRPPVVAVPPTPPSTHDAEAYNHIPENDFIAVADDPRSTFSIDVDTASYSNTRRFLREGRLPPPDAVRIEELVNYFEYEYAQPAGPDPFSVTTEVAACPWNKDHRLVHVGLQGKKVATREVPPRNLVFLVDVSGSMSDRDKLPLLKRGLQMLAEQIREQDRVSMVVYAGASGVVLEPTSDRRAIKDALARLESGGSTNGGAGIELAYRLAAQSFVKGGINRVILATDGDFNVGVTSQGGLVRLIEDKRKTGVFLSVLGFGRGNLKDATMEQLADKGNGNYAYIDSQSEAHKVLVEQAGATLMTIAKDVKIQVEFNPAEVASYRLVGYENRKLAHRDFNDDTKDAGEIGAGHTVTALYEIVPVGQGTAPEVDALKYQEVDPALTAAAGTGELMNVKLRYKQPNGARSKLLSVPVHDGDGALPRATADFRFSAAVAEFGLLLRQSQYRGDANWAQVYDLAEGAQGHDPHGRRAEFMSLVRQAAEATGGTINDRTTKVAR